MLSLEKHSIEGGYFKEIFRSDLEIPARQLNGNFSAKEYRASTAIYYLLSAEDKSSMHAIACDETWHFYKADNASTRMLLLVISPDGKFKEVIKIGSNIELGEVPVYTVKRGWFMGGKVVGNSSEAWALMGTTVAPSFEYVDYKDGDTNTLKKLAPEFADFLDSIEK